METDIVEIDEENDIVLVFSHDETDPNGEPLVVQYTLEEWEQLNK